MQLLSVRPNRADSKANKIRKEKRKRKKQKEKKKRKKRKEKIKVGKGTGAKNAGLGGDQPRYMAKAPCPAPG